MASKPRFRILFATVFGLLLVLSLFIAWGLMSRWRSLPREQWLEQPWRGRVYRVDDPERRRVRLALYGVGGDTAVEVGWVRLVLPGVSCSSDHRQILDLPPIQLSHGTSYAGEATMRFRASAEQVDIEVAGVEFTVRGAWLYIDGDSAELAGRQATQFYLDPQGNTVRDNLRVILRP